MLSNRWHFGKFNRWAALPVSAENLETLKHCCRSAEARSVGDDVESPALVLCGDNARRRLDIARFLARQTHRRLVVVRIPELLRLYFRDADREINHLFDLREKERTLLFFDEADSLLGQRHSVQKKLSYLLARMADHTVPVILSSGIPKISPKVKADLSPQLVMLEQ